MTVKKIRELGRPSYKLFWQNTGNSWEASGISEKYSGMGQGGDGGVHGADLCEEVSWCEVVGILKHLQRGKAPGPDGILNVIWRI